MKLAVITGVSRGLGASLALELLKKDFEVYGLSRNPNPDLESWNTGKKKDFHFITTDLGDIPEMIAGFEGILSSIRDKTWEQIILINDAGILDPIKALSECEASDLSVNITVNLTAPLAMSARFIKMTRALSEDRRIINISSGAGRKPYYGWSAYCAAKAGMDMFSEVAGVEMQEDAGFRIVSLAPGILDTRMQEVIRATEKKDFPLLDTFIGYHESGELAHPDDVAARIVINFVEGDFESGTLQDIRDFM